MLNNHSQGMLIYNHYLFYIYMLHFLPICTINFVFNNFFTTLYVSPFLKLPIEFINYIGTYS
jgi:hypothetical protein